MTRVGIAVLLLLAGCDRAAPVASDSPGARLEAAARARGMVPDPARATLVGSWARDTDRLCVVPGEGAQLRVGAAIDYGDGQGCAASGTAVRSGDKLRVRFGGCRFEARFDGERVIFPAEVPTACETLCTGRASLAALTVDRLSESASEAATMRSSRGKPLCAG